MASTGEVWRLGRRPALDGLRGVAALLVVGTHAAAFLLPAGAPGWLRITGAGLGVDLFFVLSGFLIAALLLREHEATGDVDIPRFYARRARRLLPAALTVLGAWSVIGYLLGDSVHRIGRTALVVLTYTTNYYKSADRDVAVGVGHFWTLAVEEQFYLVAPAVLLFLMRRKVSPRRLVGGLLVVAAAVVAYRFIQLGTSQAEDVMFRTEVRCDGLLLGVALAVAWNASLPIVGRIACYSTPALAAFITLALTAPRHLFDGPAGSFAYAAAAVLAVVAIAGGVEGTLPGFLAARPMRRLGEVSYSLYLWHVPVVALVAGVGAPAIVAVPAAVAISLAAAFASRRYIELPFMTRVHHGRAETSMTAPATVPPA